ncbi:hypothetical protein ACFY93_23050 [Streptomyces sp. NPDC008313]|uniref:hypothetical protein n=1 Tax=Streptomyces sp. NPDC008313 TaxID=3364826 RepID=UPI0036E334A6
MPRGRHRHSPPLHRLLPPSAIAGVSLVCAVGPWLFTEPLVLRGLAAGAAVTAVVGAFVMRRWDAAAGRRVADLTRARASDEWRYEERVAELETDLDESRELRVKLEHKLRAKRAELAGLRNEHAALLRRYATAETERATALEGRRLLAIETTVPSRELTAGPSATVAESGTRPGSGTGAGPTSGSAGGPDSVAGPDSAVASDAETVAGAGVFSPGGSALFLRADAALSRLAEAGRHPDSGAPDGGPEPTAAEETADEATADGLAEGGADVAKGGPVRDAAVKEAVRDAAREAVRADAVRAEPVRDDADPAPGASASDAPAGEDEAQGKPGAADEHGHAAAVEKPAEPVAPVKRTRPSGHFTVPTAVAVAPQSPSRRPSVQGGFDFFGTQKDSSADAMEAVQNEDLADVVGQEALALHKAESEGVFKPADEESRGIGQVIDLTAHDETEQIDLTGLRSAVS